MSDIPVTRPKRQLVGLASLAMLAAAIGPTGETRELVMQKDDLGRDRPAPRRLVPRSRRYIPKEATTKHDHARIAKAEAKRARKRQRNLRHA